MSASTAGVHTLVNAHGASATVAALGATLVELKVPDRDGKLGNVVLGLDDPAAYAAQRFFLGATCGRVANRIRDARFTLGGVTYELEANDPPHHLHGGSAGWHRAVWTAGPEDRTQGRALALHYASAEGEAGYPGAVDARVVYTLTDDTRLRIEMTATASHPTPIGLTHHSYWNLAGTCTVLDHLLTLFADAYTPGDPIVPTGAVEPVAGTWLDHRSPQRVSPELDHNFVVGATTGPMRTVARLFDPRSGRTMIVKSDQPGLQVYAGKFLDGSTAGRGVAHVRHAGLCLETQAFPNAINVPEWRSQVLLHPGDTYRHTVIYAFSTDSDRGVSLPRLLLAYHFFHPDDVVSARIFSDLAVEQQRRGWEVEVVTSNRSCFDRDRAFAAHEDWNGIQIHRVFRPPWSQARPLQRLANSGWMTSAWLARIARLGAFDAVIVGSDPAFGPTLARGLRRLQPSAALAHWCFDLYPEAIAAEGGSAATALLIPIARNLMRWGYGAYDALVDIGPRMQERLAAYGTGVAQKTLVPWALVEPAQPATADPRLRAELYPRAKLALLYAGTMGRAHDHRMILELARACRARSGDDVAFCFAARGNRHDELRADVTAGDTNVTFAPFIDEGALPARLGAADIHLVSLRPEWAGVVVPSKFFGSLAVGRPVLYAGPADSEIARWVAQHDIGLTLGPGADVGLVADRLQALTREPAQLARWQARAFTVYQREFSKKAMNDRWDETLRDLVARRRLS